MVMEMLGGGGEKGTGKLVPQSLGAMNCAMQ